MSSIIGFNVETKTKTNSPPSLFSKVFGGNSSEVEHFIDWDISLAILNSNGKLLSQECFIFYNNLNYGNGIITLRADSINFLSVKGPEFDEEVNIDFSKLPTETSSINFYLSNHQEFNFDITNVDVQIENIENLSDQKFRISNSTTCNAIELFKFQKTNNRMWNIEILNTSINGSNGLVSILKNIS